MAQSIDPSSPLSLRLLPDADHDLNIARLSEAPRSEFAPEYPELVTTWVDEVAPTAEPFEVRDDFPEQARISTPLAPLAWWESEWVHLVVLIILGAGFVIYPAAKLVTWLRTRRRPPEGTDNTDGSKAATRSWAHNGLSLALAVLTVVLVVLLAVRIVRPRATTDHIPTSVVVLLIAGVVFIPWAFYWGRLLP